MKDNKLPYKEICFECAIARGARTEGCHTVSMSKCPYCKKEKGIQSVHDFIWPKKYNVKYIWD